MYLMAVLLISSMMARADETITVSATNSDIAANLDLKVVAKLFGEAKDLEDFEQRLNNPDSAFVNLDLNGDGDVDYIRVIETTNGNRHLIVLQAVLAKDIYQDVASIYVEKDEANNVSVQVIGDEYIYGENYVIEPVYIYRPVIYDWFWSPYWVCWNSPWYWGYWPFWWHTWGCVHYWAYWDHCYHFHHHHHGCSFHYAKAARPASRTMHDAVRRDDYARSNPGKSFSERNRGMTNARQLPVTTRTASTSGSKGVVSTAQPHSNMTTTQTRTGSDRTYGSSFTQSSRSTTSTSTTVKSQPNTSGSHSTVTTTRSGSTNSGSSSRTTSVSTRSGGTVSTTNRSGNVGTTTSTRQSSVVTTTSRPSTSSGSSSRTSSTSSSSRSGSSSTTYRPSSVSGSTQSSHGSFGGGSFGGSSGGSRGGSSGGGSTRSGGGASPRR